MGKKKNTAVHLLSFSALCLCFVLCRYVFFHLHGMKQLPVWLFAAGLAVVAASSFLGGKLTSLCTAAAYPVGFIGGLLFQTDGVDAGGGAANDLWIIWTAAFVCLTLAGVLWDLFFRFGKGTTA